MEAFERLRSVQFDPIAPVGCNHDLVLQARVPRYRIGDWEKVTYEDRLVYDGWDKQASLVPFEGWPLRRYYYSRSENSRKVLAENAAATEAILSEIETRGPLLPKELEFQEHREELRGTWYGPSLTKNILRALWHTGRIMTAGRRKGQHVYDLTERVVPAHLLEQPELTTEESIRGIALERHRAMGILRPNAGYETWSYIYAGAKTLAIKELIESGEVVPVDVEGTKAHATPKFLDLLDLPSLEPRVIFVAPLDQLMWDRGMIKRLFDFEYIWEIYTPEHKRRWGYYVLPVLYGDRLVARVEFYARAGVLEIRRWHWEEGQPVGGFLGAFEAALKEFMRYCSAHRVTALDGVDSRVRDVATVVGSS